MTPILSFETIGATPLVLGGLIAILEDDNPHVVPRAHVSLRSSSLPCGATAMAARPTRFTAEFISWTALKDSAMPNGKAGPGQWMHVLRHNRCHRSPRRIVGAVIGNTRSHGRHVGNRNCGGHGIQSRWDSRIPNGPKHSVQPLTGDISHGRTALIARCKFRANLGPAQPYVLHEYHVRPRCDQCTHPSETADLTARSNTDSGGTTCPSPQSPRTYLTLADSPIWCRKGR